MRWTLVLVAACASSPPAVRAPAPVAPRPAPVAVAPAPVALPTFGRPGELFLLVVENGKAQCQAWQVDPAEHTLTMKHSDSTTTIQYEVSGSKLKLVDYADDDSTASCSSTFEMKETQDALVAEHAKWFRTADACAGAIAMHARVATDLACGVTPMPTAAEVATTRPTFEKILARGGAMFSIVSSPKGDICQRVTFTPSRQPRDKNFLEGELSYPIESQGVKGTEAYGYDMRRGGDMITLLGPSRSMQDGSGMAYGCGGQSHVDLFADRVELGSALYYTQAACRAAIDRETETATWFPATDDEEVAQQLGTPAIGGC